LFGITFFVSSVSAQNKGKSDFEIYRVDSMKKIPIKGTPAFLTVYEGDTIPMVNLPTVRIATTRAHQSASQRLEWERLVRKVKKVYPYAKMAGERIKIIEAQMNMLDKKRDKKRFVKDQEKMLFAEFEDDLKNMTVSEGVILIKLIDRQTGNSSFDLVQDFKGNFNAFMWQTVARVFGHNLKTKYDPNGQDKNIEQIVKMIEEGDL